MARAQSQINPLAMDHLEAAAKALAGPLVLSTLLPGVEVKFYSVTNGHSGSPGVYCDVLLSPVVYPDRDALPKRGNRPRTNGDDGRWWYDFGKMVAGQHDNDRARAWKEPTHESARATLNDEVTALLAEIVQLNLRTHLRQMVEGL